MLQSPVTIKSMCISLGICTGIDNQNKIIWIQDFQGVETAHSFNKHTKDLRISTKAEIEKAKELLSPSFGFDTPEEEEITQKEWEEGEEAETEEEAEEVEEVEPEYSEDFIDYLCNRWEDAHEQHLIEIYF